MTTELEPTPGPWATEYRKRKDGMYAQEVFDSTGKTIATCDWYPVQLSSTTTATNRAANGRLIAAAPELLEALKEARHAIVNGGFAIGWNADRLDEVITKANGV